MGIFGKSASEDSTVTSNIDAIKSRFSQHEELISTISSKMREIAENQQKQFQLLLKQQKEIDQHKVFDQSSSIVTSNDELMKDEVEIEIPHQKYSVKVQDLQRVKSLLNSVGCIVSNARFHKSEVHKKQSDE